MTNYDYNNVFLEITFPDGDIKRLRKSEIIEITQLKLRDGKINVKIV